MMTRECRRIFELDCTYQKKQQSCLTENRNYKKNPKETKNCIKNSISVSVGNTSAYFISMSAPFPGGRYPVFERIFSK